MKHPNIILYNGITLINWPGIASNPKKYLRKTGYNNMYIWFILIKGFNIARFAHKKVGICGFTGGGKTWCIMHCTLFAI